MGVSLHLAAALSTITSQITGPAFVFPAETERQIGTIMSWPTEYSILDEVYQYAGSNVSETRREIASIAKAIAKYQPVHMFVKDPDVGEIGCLEDSNLRTARELLGNVTNVTLNTTPNVHSLWARDSGPVFVRSEEGPINITWGPDDAPGVGFTTKNTSTQIVGLQMNFNQWGRKNNPNPDGYFAATASEMLDRSYILAPFVAEGGAIEVDGEGTLLATQSSILNPNRNPGVSKDLIEDYFATYLGVEKTVWIPGFRGGDITDDHIDGLARFASPGVVLVSKPFVGNNTDAGDLDDYNDVKDVLNKTTDAKGRTFRTVDVPEPDPAKVLGEDFYPGDGPTVSYVNYLVVNRAVIVAAFGDEEADAEAARIIGKQYPGRAVEQVYLHQLAVQGGGIHCATQQILA